MDPEGALAAHAHGGGAAAATEITPPSSPSPPPPPPPTGLPAPAPAQGTAGATEAAAAAPARATGGATARTPREEEEEEGDHREPQQHAQHAAEAAVRIPPPQASPDGLGTGPPATTTTAAAAMASEAPPLMRGGTGGDKGGAAANPTPPANPTLPPDPATTPAAASNGTCSYCGQPVRVRLVHERQCEVFLAAQREQQAKATAAAAAARERERAEIMAPVLAQQADPAACTLELGDHATPSRQLRVQIFRVNATSPLRLDEEDKAIQHIIAPPGVPRDSLVVDVRSLGHASFADIATHMDRFRPHCVHFMGHGTEERLVLVNDDGQSRRYGAAEIATLFSTQPQCFLAVFNCCLSAPIARAVCEQGGVFATFGTSTKIGDSAALTFAKALWGGVLLKPLGAAFTQARLSGPYHLFRGSNPPSPPPTQGSQPPAQPATDPSVLQAMLKEQYTSAAFTKIRILDFEANTAIQLEEIYTRLAIVDAQAQQVREAGTGEEVQSRVDLAVEFDTLYNPKQPSHIDHLFGKPGEPTSKRVLALGRAGIGKTTLSRKIAHLWATGHPPLTSRFDLVFRITLRRNLPAKDSIAELLHHVCLGASRTTPLAQLDAALEQAGPRVLLLLDGYDEFQAERCPLLQQMIEGELNPGFSVLITSRPDRAQQLMRSSAHNDFFALDNVFELLGFSTAAINEYVGKYFATKPDTAAGMVKYLEAHPTVQGAARVPIVAALLCILYESHEVPGAAAGELPSTLTGIFQGMVEYLLGRARQRLHLQGDDDETRLQAALEFLEALAWEGMQEDRILFSRAQLDAFAQPPHRVERATRELALQLGFLTTAESRRANERVARVEYHFLHLTLQEFLAARHLQRTRQLRLPWWKKRLPLARVKVFENRQSLRMVWQFGCGLLGAKAGHLLRTIVATVKKDKRQALLALQCQAESGCPELVGLLKGVFKDGKIDLSNTQLSATELTAVVDVVKRFKIRVLDLSGNSGLRASDADVLGPALRGERGPEEVRVGGCGLVFIARLVHLGAAGLETVDLVMEEHAGLLSRVWTATLDLSETQLDAEFWVALAEALQGNTTLKSLDLHGNSLGPASGVALSKALRGSPAIAAIDLSDRGLHPEHQAAFAELLQGTRTALDFTRTSLGAAGWACLAEALKGNTTLTSLDLRDSKLGQKSGMALSDALQGNTTLTSLDLRDNYLGPEGGAALAETLRGNTTLTSLDLSNNSLRPEGGVALAEALQGNTTLTSIGLSSNRLELEGGAALAAALTGNTTLTSLDLSRNNLGSEGGAALAEALQGNTTLTTLDVHGNDLGAASGVALVKALRGSSAITAIDFSEDGLTAEAQATFAELLQDSCTTLTLCDTHLGPAGWACLTEALKDNVTLTTLDLGSYNLGSDGGKALGEALKGNSSLTRLNLSFNRLGSAGGAMLAVGLQGNTTLTSLDLSNSKLGQKSGMALANALQGNTTLTSLDLRDNYLGPEGGAALAEALKGNTTLTTLNLRNNNLGSKGGAALAEALKGNTTLTTLDLRSNDLSDVHRAALRHSLPNAALDL